MKKKYGQTLTDFSRLDDWGDLLILTGQVNYDHLLVVISARRGSISYDSSFERLPAQLGKYFSNNSLIVLYPDQLGEPQDAVSFLIRVMRRSITRKWASGYISGLRRAEPLVTEVS